MVYCTKEIMSITLVNVVGRSAMMTAQQETYCVWRISDINTLKNAPNRFKLYQPQHTHCAFFCTVVICISKSH